MRILITNDDSCHAEGINALYAALQKKHRVTIVAPDREQSAASHALTLNKPLRITRLDRDVHTVDGTPADCVLLALNTVFKKKNPDLVISGINHGPNLGQDVIYSGTVGAAREAALNGVNAMAVSVTAWSKCRFGFAASFAAALADRIGARRKGGSVFLNVNIPNVAPSLIRGADVTRLGMRTYTNVIEQRTDPRSNDYYWISGTPVWRNEERSDYTTVRRNRVSVSPLSLDMNDCTALEEAEGLVGADSIKKLLINKKAR